MNAIECYGVGSSQSAIVRMDMEYLECVLSEESLLLEASMAIS